MERRIAGGERVRMEAGGMTVTLLQGDCRATCRTSTKRARRRASWPMPSGSARSTRRRTDGAREPAQAGMVHSTPKAVRKATSRRTTALPPARLARTKRASAHRPNCTTVCVPRRRRPQTRNPRSVRWLASEPFKGAHFATYPTELIRPFVLAGCPPGGTVLDPFGGSGTTGLVCDQEGRDAILISLDERTRPMARERIVASAPLFAEVIA